MMCKLNKCDFPTKLVKAERFTIFGLYKQIRRPSRVLCLDFSSQQLDSSSPSTSSRVIIPHPTSFRAKRDFPLHYGFLFGLFCSRKLTERVDDAILWKPRQEGEIVPRKHHCFTHRAVYRFPFMIANFSTCSKKSDEER